MNAHNVKKFIFSSTCASYGIPITDKIDETHPQSPINPYGWSKFMLEKVLADYDKAYGLKSVIFRYFNAAGADPEGEIGEIHHPETHLIPLVLDAAIGKRTHITVFGDDYPTKDGTCIRDYIHVNDLSMAHILGLEYLEKYNKSDIFNLGNENGFSVKEIIQISEKISGRKIKSIISGRRVGDPAKLVADANKAKSVLHWKTQFNNIDDIIKTAWNFHKGI
jgi:UDP-glucose 4-epimerase